MVTTGEQESGLEKGEERNTISLWTYSNIWLLTYVHGLLQTIKLMLQNSKNIAKKQDNIKKQAQTILKSPHVNMLWFK